MNNEELQRHKEYQKYYQKMYHEKKKQDLENIKKEQGNLDKNAVLTSVKTKIESRPYQNIICILLLICIRTFIFLLACIFYEYK